MYKLWVVADGSRGLQILSGEWLWMVTDGFGWFQVVTGSFGKFRVVCCFSSYVRNIQESTRVHKYTNTCYESKLYGILHYDPCFGRKRSILTQV